MLEEQVDVRRVDIQPHQVAERHARPGEDRLQDPARREALTGTALAVLSEEEGPDGRLRLEVTFQDARHAVWAIWTLGTAAEALAPQWLRHALRDRAAALATRYADDVRLAGQPSAGQADRMSEPREENENGEQGDGGNNLRPGQYDEGGHGGMATRELEAEESGGSGD